MLRYSDAEKEMLRHEIVRALGEREKVVESEMTAGELILRRDRLRRELHESKSHDDLPTSDKVRHLKAILNGVDFRSAEEQGYIRRIMFSIRKKPSSSEMAQYIAAAHLHDPVIKFVEPRWLSENLNRIIRHEETA